jgi:hypothetical protein
MMKKMENDNALLKIRQGDVYLFQISGKLPKDAAVVAPVGENHVLAYGEATGHCHAILAEDCELYEANEKIIALAKKFGVTEGKAVTHGLRIVVNNTKLLHGTPSRGFTDPDHTPIGLRTGDYIVLRPREYSDEEEFKIIAD